MVTNASSTQEVEAESGTPGSTWASKKEEVRKEVIKGDTETEKQTNCVPKQETFLLLNKYDGVC